MGAPKNSPECSPPPPPQAFLSLRFTDRDPECSSVAPEDVALDRREPPHAGTCLDARTANEGSTSEAVVHQGTWIKATRNDGATYQGDLLSDVVEYRALRASSFRQTLGDDVVQHLRSLEAKLRQAAAADDAEAALRAFQRYNCDFPATVLFTRVSSSLMEVPRAMQVRVRDISAGGMKAVANHEMTPGELATLSISLPGYGGQSFVFPSRVAWVTQDAFGLMFAGQAEVHMSADISDEKVA